MVRLLGELFQHFLPPFFELLVSSVVSFHAGFTFPSVCYYENHMRLED